MSFLGSIGNAIGSGAYEAAGAMGSLGGLDPNSFASSLTRTGHNISNPAVNMNGMINPGYVPARGTITAPASQTPQGASSPNSGVYTGSLSAAGGSGSGSASDPNVAAYTDQIGALQQLLGNADVNYNQGVDSINTGFQNASNQLQGQLDTANNNYATQKTNTQQDYSKALNTINANARNGYNSLEQLLGGTGSAGNILAPFAVSTQANQQRQGSSDAYAKNLQAIDQGVAAAQQNYANQKKTIEGQHGDQLKNLLSSINNQKMNYQQQIAADQNQLNIAKGGSYQTPTAINNNIQALIQAQNDAAKQYATPTFTVQDYTAPQLNLQNYQSQAAQIANGGNTNDPSLQGLDATGGLQNLLKQTTDNNTSAYSY